MIVVHDLPNGVEYAPMLRGDLAAGLDRVEARWGDLCREIGAKHLLPDGWLQAMIWRESGGNPLARNRENPNDPDDDGIGLLQITSRGLKGKHTDEELFEPRLNIDIGSRYISWLASLPAVKGDFPRVCAAFNAGSVKDSSKNRWGMVQTEGHCDAEVAALNYWISRKEQSERLAAERAAAQQFSLIELVDDHPPAGIDDAPETERKS